MSPEIGGGRFSSALMALLLVTSAIGAVGVAAAASVNWSDTAETPDPYIDVDRLTKATHEMEWGAGEAAAVKYYDDNGDVVSGDFSVNSSVDNPYQFYVTNVNDTGLGEFPRKDAETGENTASALDASEWTKDAAGSAGTGSVADATPAEGVDAVRLSTSGQGAGDVMVFTYSNFTIDSDVSKRVLALAANVDTLDSGATVAIRAEESDGDYVEISADTAENYENDAVFANATGDGQVSQQKVSDLSVAGTGDGSLAAIDKLTVTVSDADVDMTITWLDVDRKTKTTLAVEKKDTDSDDALESVDVVEPHGEIATHSLESLPTIFDDAAINDLAMPVRYSASDLDSDDVAVEREATDKYVGYDGLLTLQYRLAASSAIDISVSGADVELDQQWPSDRYVGFEIIEGAGDTEFSELDYDSSGTDVSGSLADEGDTVALDGTVQPGTEYAVRIKFRGTATELDRMMAVTGGGGGLFGGGGGGLFGWLGGVGDWIVGGIMGLLGLFGIKRGAGS